jgi:hypothetical protein
LRYFIAEQLDILLQIEVEQFHNKHNIADTKHNIVDNNLPLLQMLQDCAMLDEHHTLNIDRRVARQGHNQGLGSTS